MVPGNWHARFGGGPCRKGPANRGHLAARPTQPLFMRRSLAPRMLADAADRARSSPARKPSAGAAARGCSRRSTSSPPGLNLFTLPVWLAMNDPGQDPGTYLHVHSVLARRIRGGEYPAGARLPTEAELADEFGCRPETAARALRALHRDGLARKVPRRRYESSGPDAHPG